MLHVTAVLGSPATVAVNCCCSAGASETAVGVSVMVTAGTRFTEALADFVGSAELVAVTKMVWGVVMTGGA